MSQQRLSTIATLLMFALSFLITAIFMNIWVVNPLQTESHRWGWATCNTTAFRIDDAAGIATFHSSKCEWVAQRLFVCNDDSDLARCVTENTNRFNNPLWYCMMRAEDDCNAGIRFSQPDYTRSAAFVIMVVFYVFGGLCVVFVVGEKEQQLRRQLLYRELPNE
jgi:FtsH-binding integral membrane protein